MELQSKITEVDSDRLIRDLLDRWIEADRVLARAKDLSSGYKISQAWAERDMTEDLLSRYFGKSTRDDLERAYEEEIGAYINPWNNR